MIQRIQSVWLLIAAIVSAGLLYFDLYHAHILMNGVDSLVVLKVSDHFPSLLLALVLIILPLVNIFLYKNRKRQRSIALLNIIAIIGFVALVLMRVTSFNNQTPPPTNGSYWIGSVLPVIAMVLVIMAMSAIKKDEKLVRSVDRLR
jgi:uncharacterized membrane protein